MAAPAPVNFLSLNVASSSNLAGLNTAISTASYDVILLQEMKMTQEQLDPIVKRFGFKAHVNVSEVNQHKPGTAILWRNSVPLSGLVNLVECRLQMAELGPYRIFNCYAPSGSENRQQRNIFFGEELFKCLRIHPGSLCIVAGDYNCVTRREDVEGGVGYQTKKCEVLKNLVLCEKFVDAFLHLHSDKQEFTFHRPGKAKSRLDRYYVSESLAEGIEEVDHIPSLSDHFGVKMKIKMNINIAHFERKKDFTYWKLNNQILEDDEFMPSFRCLWAHLVKNENKYNDVADWWDLYVKPEIKKFSIAFSANRKDRRNQTKQFLLSALKLMQEENDWEEVIRIRDRINTMLVEDLMGYKIRSKSSQGLEQERASLYHAAREQKNYSKVTSGLKIGNKIVTDKKTIEAEVVGYFNALFNGHHGSDLQNKGVPFVPDWTNLDMLLKDLGKISDNDRKDIIEDIKEEEMGDIINDCPNMKSPGLDGLSYEFYKKCWGIIGAKFIKILQVQLKRRKLIQSDLMGATKLAPKVEGVPEVDELRPITLLNTDYKLLTKWLVRRLKPLMRKLIRSGQLCNSGDKNILFGVQNILSGLGYVNSKKLGAALISLDFFKAYDRVFVPFLLKVMEKMNFCDIFCGWIKMLHSQARTRFILSFLTKDIAVSFSIRQGDPLSMFLYVIYVEPLLVLLEKKLQGLVVGNIRQVLEAFCDDIDVFVTNEDDLTALNTAVVEFEKASGAILSRNKKCKILGLGRWSKRTVWGLDFLQPVKEVKVFGIWMMGSYRDLLARNWSYRLDKFRGAVFSWSTRRFDSVKQRVEVINSFGLSRIFYVASVLPMSNKVIKNINQIIGDFLWKKSGKVLRIPMNEVINSEEKGGLGLLSMETMAKSLIVSQMLRLMKSEDEKSKSHFNFWMVDLVCDIWEGPQALGVQWGTVECEYFNSVGGILVEAKLQRNIRMDSWKLLSNKSIYKGFAEDFTKTKVERESVQSMDLVWSRLKLLGQLANRQIHEVSYLLVHNKLPIQERLFRIGLARDPYCDVCSAGLDQDVLHYFSKCDRIQDFWRWLRTFLYLIMGAQANLILDVDLLSFSWRRSTRDREITWLVSCFVWFVWESLERRGLADINGRELFGFLRFKYKEALRRGMIVEIPGLI